jgi:hypothetical protein
MLWDQKENKIVYSAWVWFADDPLQPTTGKRQIPGNLDPKLLHNEEIEDKIGDVLDPALCQRATAMRFVMACELGDFTAENLIKSQEQIIDKISNQTASPPPAPPKKYKDILKHPHREEWLKAIQEELQNLFRHDIWTIELVPEGKWVMGAQWVFVEKRTQDGKLIKLKARYVAKGYAQIAGVEFLDTFAPTATFVSLRLLLKVAARCSWPVYSFNFVAAYLHSPIDEEVWVKPPEGLDVPAGHACKLKKALYGTRQAARCWWKHLQDKLGDLGYTPSQYNNSLYILKHATERGAIWVHVDNGVVTGSNNSILKKLEDHLKDCLEIKWQSGVDTIVGVEVIRTDKGFTLRQKKLIDKILLENWDNKSLARNPLPTGYSADSNDKEGNSSTSTEYLSLIGGLSYLAVGTRPDVAFAVNYMARFSAKPSPGN